jgi:hypothetical protein
MNPLFKWTGGKRKEIKIFSKYFPSDYETYIEPFFGGGAVYWYLNANKNIINDVDVELTNFLKVIKGKKIFNSANIFSIAVFINIFPLVPTGSFFNNWLSTVYFLPLAFFFYSLEKQK